VEQKVEFVLLEGNFILYFCFFVNVFQTHFNSRQINDKPGDQTFSSKVIENESQSFNKEENSGSLGRIDHNGIINCCFQFNTKSIRIIFYVIVIV
jgi:hypothetical protein